MVSFVLMDLKLNNFFVNLLNLSNCIESVHLVDFDDLVDMLILSVLSILLITYFTSILSVLLNLLILSILSFLSILGTFSILSILLLSGDTEFNCVTFLCSCIWHLSKYCVWPRSQAAFQIHRSCSPRISKYFQFKKLNLKTKHTIWFFRIWVVPSSV